MESGLKKNWAHIFGSALVQLSALLLIQDLFHFSGDFKRQKCLYFFHARLLETFRWVNFIDGAETSNVRD